MESATQKMHDLVEVLIDEHGFKPDIIAEKLMADEGELVVEWLGEQAQRLVKEFVRHMAMKARAKVRSAALPSLTTSTAERAATDRSVFEMPYEVQGNWKPLGEMTKADCLYVAEQRAMLKTAHEKEEKLMRAIARKCGNRTVAQVFSEAQLRSLFVGFKASEEAA